MSRYLYIKQNLYIDIHPYIDIFIGINGRVHHEN